MERYPTIPQCALLATAFKLLLFPSYRSTDFEVHRNWLAITGSLPVKDWYYEQTSEWTLDYPPFFAAFEWLLSQAALLWHPQMLGLKNLEYDSWQTIYFQRTTVIVSELVLVYALHFYVKTSPQGFSTAANAAALSVLLSPGLLLIDHIHFQYNGFLYGVLVLSLVLAREQSTRLLSGVLFAVLLCLKHIYLYLAPAYFIFLLRAYCLGRKSAFDVRLGNVLKLGTSVVGVFGVAFGPFIYWVAPRLGLKVDDAAINSVTRGLVGDSSFAILPDITPQTTFALTLLFQLICLVKLFVQPSWETFIGAVTLCGYSSFLFGWHVHEKAILLIIVPFSLLALKDRRYLGAFRPLAVAGHVSLFPLLFTAPGKHAGARKRPAAQLMLAEFPIKIAYTVFWLLLFLCAFDRLAPV
ncbi:MAG: glycosyl transferase [Piccolia ochrophora]|nr:MAG: glycosyl transferase [Piccolia ochrophora]